MRQTIHHRTLSLIVESINIGAFLDKEVDQASAVCTVNVEYSQPIIVGNVAVATMARKQIDESFNARSFFCALMKGRFSLLILFVGAFWMDLQFFLIHIEPVSVFH